MENNLTIARSGAILPTNLEDAYRLAKAISLSGLAPDGMKEPEKVLVAILTGMEIGLSPMFAVQKIAVINGRPSIWGDAVPALLYARGFKIDESSDPAIDGGTATCTVTRPDGRKITRTFSMKQAQAAGLTNKPGPWKQYPARMLQMRARGYAARDGAADVLSGLYLSEELDEPMRDITPTAAPPPLPDLPDIPDIPDAAPAPAADTPDTDAADADVVDDEPLGDPDGYIAMLRAERRTLSSAEELAAFALDNAPLVPRLPPTLRTIAAAILSEEGEQ